MKIEEGKYYKTANGRKVGPAMDNQCLLNGQKSFCMGDSFYYVHLENGTYFKESEPKNNLVSEWRDGPVVTEKVTRIEEVKKIESGRYGPKGGLEIHSREDIEAVNLRILTSNYTASEIKEFAALLTEIAEAM